VKADEKPRQTTDDRATQLAQQREFISLFLQLSKRSQKQVCYLMQAYEAGNRRAWLAAAWYWLAFFATHPAGALACMRVQRAGGEK
jgi:hypothetical protein